MDENNVNGFDNMDDDDDEGTTVLTTPGVNAFSAPQNNNQPVGQPAQQTGQAQYQNTQQGQYGGFSQPEQMQYGGFGQPQSQNTQQDQQPEQMQYGGFGQQNGQPGQFGQQSQQNGQPGQFVQPGQQNGQPGQFGQPGQQNGQPGQFGQPGQQYGQPGQFVQPGQQYGQPGQFVQPGQQYGQPGQQFNMAPGNMEPGKKINKKLIAIIGGIAAAVIIVIVVLVLLLSGGGQRSAEKVGDKLVSAYEDGDADAMVDLMKDDYYELYNKVRSITGSDDYVKDNFNEQVDDMVDEVGKVKSITIEDRSNTKYDKDELEDVNNTLDVMNIDMKVDECQEIDLDVKIKGADDEADGEITYTVVKSGGKWYLVDYDMYIY